MATKYYENLTREQIDYLQRRGINPYSVEAVPQKIMPYTSAGATQMRGAGLDSLRSGLRGITFPEGSDPSKYSDSGYSGRSHMLLNKDQPPEELKKTLAHEMEHALMVQNLSTQGKDINSEWERLTGYGVKDRAALVRKLAEHGPYLRDKWGLDPEAAQRGYFGKGDATHHNPNLLQEQFATLSSLEQDKNKRLTDDPYIREHIFTSPTERAAYNALTGLRQTRLDAKDLPPYTLQPDKNDQTMMDKVKSLFKFAKGGYIPNAGNNKLI